MSIEIVKPVVAENGIEFYVSSDGSQVGVSISGLARLCGVDRKTIQNLLAADKTSPKGLQSLPEGLFTLRLEGVNGAKIINSHAATQIIKYYAYESKAANDTAKFSLSKFLDIGFTTWVKQVTGFSVSNNNEMLTKTLNELYNNVNILTQEMREWRTVRRVADERMEGVNILIEEINAHESEKEQLTMQDLRSYTLMEWLQEEKNIPTMSRGNLSKLGRSVAETYKSLRQYKPTKVRRMYRNRRTNSIISKVVAGYTKDDFPILEVAYCKYLGS